jgi:PhnB protein
MNAAHVGGPAVTSIQPELWVDRGAAALAFYKSAFGASVLHRVGEGDDIVAQLVVGDAAFWIAATGSSTERLVPRAIGGATSRMLHVVDDPDTVVAQALAAGAQGKSPVEEEHGWRVGRIIDPFGHEWEIGKPLIAWPPESPSQ